MLDDNRKKHIRFPAFINIKMLDDIRRKKSTCVPPLLISQ